MARLGPYTILRRLAVGGMAEVFLARREGPARVAKVVALKRILPHLSESPDFVAMFLDEARLASRLSHPNIVQLHDFGEANGAYFLAMEYVAGEDLLAVLRRCRERVSPMPATIAATVLASACEALHHAHELRDEHDRPLGLVHRDVTPSNLLIAYDGAVKLTDFGIAKIDRGAKTITGSPKGKLPYMSPEQVLAQRLDRRSDLFSLAVVGHELLTGERLFHRDSELLLLKAITEQPIGSPRERRSDVPPALDHIIMRSLEREPARRFATAQQMQLELEGFLAAHGGIGWKLELSRYMHELFGEDAAASARRRAAGENDDGEPTRALQRPKTRTRGRARRSVVMAALSGLVLGAGGLAVWSSRSRAPDQRAPEVPALPITDNTRPPAPPPSAPSVPRSGEPSPQGARDPRGLGPRGDRSGSGPAAATAAKEASSAKATWAYLSVDRGVTMDVLLDDRLAGTTPILRKRIKPGSHTLVLRGREGNRLTSKFVVRAGEEHADARPLQRGSLTCDVTPWAEVYIGERKLGMTPLSGVRLFEGTYSLRLSNPELHREQTMQVTVRPGETVRVKATLER